MQPFNPDTFLSTTTTDANSTKTTPCPEGEFMAVVDSVKARPWQGKADPSKSGIALDVVWSVDDYNVKQQLERDKVTVKQGIMLDLSESGGLDMGKGKNVGLGRLREACGLNVPGEPFAPSMLVGRIAKIKVKHRIDGEDIFADVDAVAKV